MASESLDESTRGASGDAEELSPLESELLEEYERLSDNMRKVGGAHTDDDFLVSFRTSSLTNEHDSWHKS